MKNKGKPIPADDDRRQADAEKTSRLRALRLAKEAADKEAAAALEAAVNAAKPPRRRAAAAPPVDRSAPA
jgi:hypothetical protein